MLPTRAGLLDRELRFLGVEVNKRTPDVVKDLMHIRLELKGAHIQQLDSFA